jgi:hypothetical protein
MRALESTNACSKCGFQVYGTAGGDAFISRNPLVAQIEDLSPYKEALPAYVTPQLHNYVDVLGNHIYIQKPYAKVSKDT